MSDTCGGQCCKEFFLPHTPSDLGWKALAHAWFGDDYDYVVELCKIATMTRFTRMCGPGDTMPGGRVAEEAAFPNGPEPLYGCVYFDGRHCTDYAGRPIMCRDFPYGRPCQYGDACTWDAGREGRYPEPELICLERAEVAINDHPKVHLPVLP